MKIKELLKEIEFQCLQGNLEEEITGFCQDNRSVEKGDLFVCIAGARFDTHNCIDDIAKKGAKLIVVERKVTTEVEGVTIVLVSDTRRVLPLIAAAYYGHPADKLTTIGVTGSKGKTTTTHMLADMLRSAGYKVGTIGTNGAIFGDNIVELNNSTPDPQQIQMYLSMMVKAGCTHAVIEVSSQGMKQHRVDGFTFDYSIFTNISTGDHIGPNEHKDFEEYLYCKAMLLEHSKLGFVNMDDEHCKDLLKYITKPVKFFGENKVANIVISNVKKVFEHGQPGIVFETSNELKGTFYVNLPGEFNSKNALAAISVANEIGVSIEEINDALGHMNIKGRLDMVYRSPKFSVCVDFAHNGFSTRNLLVALREYKPKRLVCVFGADGNRSKHRRYEMGEASGNLADLSIITAGHNRFESFEDILKDIHVGMDKTTGSYLVIPNRKEAIKYAIEHAEEGDLITIIGLGHETYQEENGMKYPHSDTEYVKQVIKGLGL